MKNYPVRVYPSKERLNREDQLAWKIASVAVDVAPVDLQATDMVINRIIDNTFLAIAAANGEPPEAARAQALTHPREKGVRFLGCNANISVDAEWAAWANQRADYIRKVQTLSEGLFSEREQERFLSLVQNFPNLSTAQVADINVEMNLAKLNVCMKKGIF